MPVAPVSTIAVWFGVRRVVGVRWEEQVRVVEHGRWDVRIVGLGDEVLTKIHVRQLIIRYMVVEVICTDKALQRNAQELVVASLEIEVLERHLDATPAVLRRRLDIVVTIFTVEEKVESSSHDL